MTAATVEALPSSTDVYGLETSTAIRAAVFLDSIADTGVRRTIAATLVEERREELALYRALLVERFGAAPALERIIAGDEVLAELTILAIA